MRKIGWLTACQLQSVQGRECGGSMWMIVFEEGNVEQIISSMQVFKDYTIHSFESLP